MMALLGKNSVATELDNQSGDALSQRAQIHQEPSSLWQAAYEHPKTTIAVGVGLAAVAGAALYLSHGRLAKLLHPGSQDVLVVEAAPFMGKAMKGSLEAAGHRVTLVSEIGGLKPLTGTTLDGKEVSLNLRRFDTAFIDPNHVHKSAVNFEQLAPMFKSANVRTIGTSVMTDVNKDMLASGIDIAANKPTLLASLVGNRLDLQEAVRAPQQTQAALKYLSENMNTPEFAELHRRTSETLTKYAGLNGA